MSTQFWLIRHGETDWNVARKLQGWRDIPLNPTGIAQANALALALQPARFPHAIHAVVSSDLSRALETARIGAARFALPVLTDAGLRERNFGVHEGADWEQMKRSAGQPGQLNVRDPQQPIEGGETLLVFQQRVEQAFEALSHQHAGRHVMVFSHGGVIDAVWRRIHGIPLSQPRQFDILNTSINHFRIDAAQSWHELGWGQTAHLAQDALDEIR